MIRVYNYFLRILVGSSLKVYFNLFQIGLNFQLNFLSIGDVVISTASDFVGSVVGESQKKTNAMLEKARGKVLVIDEAYNLDDSLYGKQVTFVPYKCLHI
jgi:hypothetical protein